MSVRTHRPRVSNMPYAIVQRSSSSSRFVFTPSAHIALLMACTFDDKLHVIHEQS